MALKFGAQLKSKFCNEEYLVKPLCEYVTILLVLHVPCIHCSVGGTNLFHSVRFCAFLQASAVCSPVHFLMSSSHVLLDLPRRHVFGTMPMIMSFCWQSCLIIWPKYCILHFITLMSRTGVLFPIICITRNKNSIHKYKTTVRTVYVHT